MRFLVTSAVFGLSAALLAACPPEATPRKGLPELALKWYQRGLEAPDLTEETRLGFLYDLGNVHLTLEDEEAALETFTEIYGIDNQFRDVDEKLEELRG